MSDLRERLLSSSAYLSFAEERKLHDELDRRSWTAVQGPTYQDLKAAKLREIDVLAHRSWRIPGGDLRVRVVVVAECKSMRGYHLLLRPAALRSLNFQSSSLAFWLGHWQSGERIRVADILSRHGFSSEEIVEYFRQASSVCYPDDLARAQPFLIEPPHVVPQFTAWRETNIGSEKDLDASVFWRAVLALDSCVDAQHELRLAHFLDDLEVDANAIEHYKANRNPQKLSWLKTTTDRFSRSVWLFHPVVVTDACIWSSENELTPVGICRFTRTDGFGSVGRWFDVVQLDQVSNWVDAITAHYERTFANAGAELAGY